MPHFVFAYDDSDVQTEFHFPVIENQAYIFPSCSYHSSARPVECFSRDMRCQQVKFRLSIRVELFRRCFTPEGVTLNWLKPTQLV